MSDFIDIYSFIPVSGCVGRAPVHGFAGKLIMLLKRPCAALTWMKSYLNDRTQRVAVGSVVSNSMHILLSAFDNIKIIRLSNEPRPQASQIPLPNMQSGS